MHDMNIHLVIYYGTNIHNTDNTPNNTPQPWQKFAIFLIFAKPVITWPFLFRTTRNQPTSDLSALATGKWREALALLRSLEDDQNDEEQKELPRWTQLREWMSRDGS